MTTSSQESRHVPVLVAGGSLVGLTTSALLADHGVPHVLVESHHGTAIHPGSVLPPASAWHGAALVRPDGAVAWRTADASAAAPLQLSLAELLDRGSAD